MIIAITRIIIMMINIAMIANAKDEMSKGSLELIVSALTKLNVYGVPGLHLNVMVYS